MSDPRGAITALLDAIDSAVVATESGRVVYANRAFRRVFALGDRAVEGRAIVQVLTGYGIDASALSPLVTSDVTITRSDQSVVVLRKGVASPIELEGRRLDVMTFTDVTTQRIDGEALEHRDRLASAGMMCAMAMHEMKSVIGSTMLDVAIALEAMLRLPHDDTTLGALGEVHESLQDIEQQTRRMQTLTTNFMEFVAPQEATTGFVDLSATARRVVQMLRPQTPGPESLTADVEDVALVVADELRVQQVLVNLVTNAIQALATHEHPGHIVVRTREADDHVLVEVADDGPGIPSDLQKRVFEPMFTTKRRGVGTGLGLFIVKRIVDDLGAKLDLESTPGAGTTFAVRFDRLVPRSESGAVVLTPDERTESKILVVDADLSTVGLIRSEVPTSELTVARSLEECDRLLKRRQFDLVFLDTSLGDDALQKKLEMMTFAHGHHPERIVLMVPYGSNDGVRSWADKAGYAVTTKPIQAAPLVSRLLQAPAPR